MHTPGCRQGGGVQGSRVLAQAQVGSPSTITEAYGYWGFQILKSGLSFPCQAPLTVLHEVVRFLHFWKSFPGKEGAVLGTGLATAAAVSCQLG